MGRRKPWPKNSRAKTGGEAIVGRASWPAFFDRIPFSLTGPCIQEHAHGKLGAVGAGPSIDT